MTTESPEHRKENLKRKNGVLLHETSTLHEKSKFQRTEKVEITVGLLKQMKSHQIEAANFVLRLLSQSSDTIDWLNEPSTGAILADDVGTGKTLVGLVVMYSLTRHFNSKGIIVAPSSLIINWKNEMKKWLPINAYNSTLFVQSNSRSDALVYKFIHSSSESIPLLVISYDLFRTFSESFNTMTNLSCLLCDEGHRMKNAGGTKTSSALSHCVAMRRLVLTGTPIQNNPDELYALIQFVSPNYLGSLSDFKARYLKDEEGKKELRIKLSKILLRRSKEEILRRDLPPRVDVIIRCPLNSLEQNMMLETIDAEVGAGKNELSDILPTLMKVRLLCSIPPPKPPSPSIPVENSISSKISAVLQIIESMVQLQRKDKIVIVSNFTMVLDSISQSLKARRLSCFRIDGSVPLEKRARIVVKFNEAENPIGTRQRMRSVWEECGGRDRRSRCLSTA